MSRYITIFYFSPSTQWISRVGPRRIPPHFLHMHQPPVRLVIVITLLLLSSLALQRSRNR